MNKIRILLIDDHAILRMGLAAILDAKPDMKVIGDAADGEAGIAQALRLRPNIVVTDLMMPGMDGAETTRRLLEAMPEARILILTSFGTADGIAHALKAGAMGAIVKDADFSELVTAIRTIADGRQYVSEELRRIMADEPPVPQLTTRQEEILGAIVRGLSNNDIAAALGIGVDMVKQHVAALCRKLGAANRTEAVAIAMHKHLLKP